MNISKTLSYVVIVLSAFTVSTSIAAPGGVSTPGLWLKSDDAGDISIAWKDSSGNNNPVEAVVSAESQPWALSLSSSDHNFHPYTTGYTSGRLFLEAEASFVSGEQNPTPLTILTVTRSDTLPSGDVAALITGLDDLNYGFSSPAREPGISLLGTESDNPGLLQVSLESVANLGFPEYRYAASTVPLSQNLLSHTVIGGVNNDQVMLGFNGSESSSVTDEPVITRGNVLSLGYGRVFGSSAFNGDIMEVIWYAEALSTDQLKKVNTYLALKYGIALNSDFVGSNDVIAWSQDLDVGFNHSVFGLGRDDVSGLHQRVSRSVESAVLTLSLNSDFLSGNDDVSRVIDISGDQQYFLTGHNNANIALQQNEISSPYSERLSREWLVQSSNFSQQVSLQFTLPDLPLGSQVYLVRKNLDSDFSNDIETLGEVNLASGVINDVILNHGDYFTLAVTLDSDGDGVLDPEDAFPNDVSESQDTDSDGVGNNADVDDDNDRYTDLDEIAAGSDSLDKDNTPPDHDGDFVSDVTDLDDDNDGVSDLDEINLDIDPFNEDSDGDGVNDGREVGDDVSMPIDSDNDGIPDVKEVTNDSDFDGLSNYLEGLIGSDPTTRDTDNDDFRDNEELAVILSKEDTDDDGIDDAMDSSFVSAPDLDGDGVVDFAVRDTDGNGTPDFFDVDSDGDGIDDLSETLDDSDGDGIADVLDPDGMLGGGDSDRDGIPDFIECCNDSDFDGQPDYTQMDTDRDYIPDSEEAALTGNDEDFDGYDDVYDADINGDGIVDNGPDDNLDGIKDSWLVLDTDGDGLPDYRDTDSDNDGLSDDEETLSGDDLVNDEDNDGIPVHLDVASGVDGGDSDGDGLTDIFECPLGYPVCADSNSDGTPNYMTTDSDGDGISDGTECWAGGDCADTDNDGIPDYIDNDDGVGTGTDPDSTNADLTSPAIGSSDTNQAPDVTNVGDTVTPGTVADSNKDHMTASTGIGAISWVWMICALGLLLQRRKIRGGCA